MNERLKVLAAIDKLEDNNCKQCTKRSSQQTNSICYIECEIGKQKVELGKKYQSVNKKYKPLNNVKKVKTKVKVKIKEQPKVKVDKAKGLNSLKQTLANYKANKVEVEEMGAKVLTYEEYNRLRSSGKTVKEIAKEYNLKETTIYTKVHAWKKAKETLADDNIVQALEVQITDLELKVQGYPELLEKVESYRSENERLQNEVVQFSNQVQELYIKLDEHVATKGKQNETIDSYIFKNHELVKQNDSQSREIEGLHEQLAEWMEKAKNYAAHNANLDKGLKDTRQVLENVIGENEAFRTVLKKVL